MSEAALWRAVSAVFKPAGIDATRHEDKLTLGIPDSSFGAWFGNGWIELKTGVIIRGGIFRYNHPPTVEQVRFLKVRGAAGGGTFVLTRVTKPRTFLLFDHHAADIIAPDRVPFDEYRAAAIYDAPNLDGLVSSLKVHFQGLHNNA